VVYDGQSRPEIGTRNVTAEDARQRITALKAQGIDFIKIYEMVSPVVFQAMVEAANELKLPIDSHVPLSMRASVAGPHLDSIEHLRNIELDCASNALELHRDRLELLQNPDKLSGYALRSSLHKEQRLQAISDYDQDTCDKTLEALVTTLQVPTLRLNAIALSPPYLREGWSDALDRLPGAVRDEWEAGPPAWPENIEEALRKQGQWSLFLTREMHSKGIPIAAGTDTPIGLAAPGYSLHSELEMLVRAGLSPLEALQSATVRPAEFFSLQEIMGTIDVGKKADMVLLNANPLDDISHTRQVAAVVSKGVFYTQAQLLDRVRAINAK